jgi:hypothetical protein
MLPLTVATGRNGEWLFDMQRMSAIWQNALTAGAGPGFAARVAHFAEVRFRDSLDRGDLAGRDATRTALGRTVEIGGKGACCRRCGGCRATNRERPGRLMHLRARAAQRDDQGRVGGSPTLRGVVRGRRPIIPEMFREGPFA